MQVVSAVRRAAVAALPLPLEHLLRRRSRYHRNFGRHLPLGRPESFTDKVNWRILHDRRVLLEGTCDKLAMKDHAQARAPGLVRVPRTLWSGADVAQLADVDLPEHWVLKPNHTTGLVHLGRGRPDTAHLTRLTEGWVDDDHWRRTGQRAYRSARRGLLVEEFVGRPGEFPADLKVYVFDGTVHSVHLHTDRATAHAVRVFTPDWRPLPWLADSPLGPVVPPPQRLGAMLSAASLLAEGFDMLRVDFYEQDGVLWFGELTPYPGGGLVVWDRPLDEEMGRMWTLPSRTRGGERVLTPPASPAGPRPRPVGREGGARLSAGRGRAAGRRPAPR